VRKDKLSESTILQKLGLVGDDAEDLMVSYTEKFHIDLNDFDFEKCFDAEAIFDPIYCLGLDNFSACTCMLRLCYARKKLVF